MLEIRIFGVKVKFSFLFVAVLTAMTIVDSTGLVVVGFASCILHEFGHIVAYAVIKKKPENISFEATGIKLTKPLNLISLRNELFILSAGCLVNFLLSAVFCSVYPIFCYANLTLGFFNLLPVLSLDGGKIIYTLLCMKMLPDTSGFILKIISAITLIPLILLGGILFYNTKNITLLITSLYLLCLLLFKSQE